MKDDPRQQGLNLKPTPPTLLPTLTTLVPLCRMGCMHHRRLVVAAAAAAAVLAALPLTSPLLGASDKCTTMQTHSAAVHRVTTAAVAVAAALQLLDLPPRPLTSMATL